MNLNKASIRRQSYLRAAGKVKKEIESLVILISGKEEDKELREKAHQLLEAYEQFVIQVGKEQASEAVKI